ncbi:MULTISPECIES: DUF433 domain-containing protein [Aerosakkonema]|uniref:DUF433 domain-containing protein n=1 Tax=Aerosakkonema TaxID=1246629 RepID=UPI0035B76D2F
MTLKELEAQLISLTPDEKVQAIQILTQSLAEKWPGIEKTAGVMGGEACIRHTRIPVWLLVSYRRDGASDAKILEGHPDVTATDLVNAFAYADANSDEIEKAIREQEEA